MLSQQNLDLIYCNYNTELYAAVRRANMYLYIPARYSCQVFLLLLCVLLYCCCCCAATACCCSSSCPGWQNLFLWFLASDSSVFFLFIQTRFVLNVPLGSTSLPSIYLVNTYHASSVIAGMRGGKAGVSLPRRTPPPCINTQ